MAFPWLTLLRLYLLLGAGVGLGVLWGDRGGPDFSRRLGDVMFWVFVPLAIAGFVARSPLDSNLLWAGPLAWLVGMIGLGLAFLTGRWIPQSPATRGSLLLGTLAGNTGFVGYPVLLALVGPHELVWGICFDVLGTSLLLFSVGIAIAARYGGGALSLAEMLRRLLLNPPLWGLGLGLLLQGRVLPLLLTLFLQVMAFGTVALALVLIGINLRRLRGGRPAPVLWPLLGIRMLVLPLVMLALTRWLRLPPAGEVSLVIQAGMPPAFSTVMLAEIYGLDRRLSATSVALGCLLLLPLLPLWISLYGPI